MTRETTERKRLISVNTRTHWPGEGRLEGPGALSRRQDPVRLQLRRERRPRPPRGRAREAILLDVGLLDRRPLGTDFGGGQLTPGRWDALSARRQQFGRRWRRPCALGARGGHREFSEASIGVSPSEIRAAPRCTPLYQAANSSIDQLASTAALAAFPSLARLRTITGDLE
jgi:hypothetical protein